MYFIAIGSLNSLKASIAAILISGSSSSKNFIISLKALFSCIFPRILIDQNRLSLLSHCKAATRGETASLPISIRDCAAKLLPIQYSFERESIRYGIECVPKSFSIS